MKLATKLMLLVVPAALVPLLIVSLLNIRYGTRAVEGAAKENLGMTAGLVAARLDQLFEDQVRALGLVSTDGDIVSFLARRDPAADRVAAQARLAQIIRSNSDLALVYVADAHGICRATSDPRTLGVDYNFRSYMQRALAGEQHVSDLVMGTQTGVAGVFFAGPILAGDGTLIGATVLKLKASAVDAICAEVGRDRAGTVACVTDNFGVMISHPDRQQMFRSTRPLTPTELSGLDLKARYATEQLQPADVQFPGAPRDAGRTLTANLSDRTGEVLVAALTGMRLRPWTVAVLQPRADFEAPLVELGRRQWLVALLVGLAAFTAALLGARRAARPIRNLTDAAVRAGGGDWSARASVGGNDEVAILARAFNAMIPKLQQRAKMEDGLRLATEVQRRLLPQAPPKVAGLQVAGLSLPADETGGDYFDFLELTPVENGRLAVVIGDVMGHGVAAALLMATARALLRGRMAPPCSPVELLSHINARLVQDVPQGRFMTLLYVLVDRAARRLQLVSAGHDPLLIYDPDTDAFQEVEGNDIPLGIDAKWSFTEAVHEGLPDGVVLFFGTDGIWEAQGPGGESYGKQRMRDVLRANARATAEEIVQAMVRDLRTFGGGTPQLDDITAIVIKVVPIDPRLEVTPELAGAGWTAGGPGRD